MPLLVLLILSKHGCARFDGDSAHFPLTHYHFTLVAVLTRVSVATVPFLQESHQLEITPLPYESELDGHVRLCKFQIVSLLDIQLLLGVILWIVSQHWIGHSALAAWEHPIIMILAVAGAHITWSRVKKQTSAPEKFRTGTIGFVITALILVLGIARMTRVV
ncbi:hypothetical protein LCGC14_1532930 [marine sediment metagenome]|uniref:Uncharacterized protein n=1 Tax=marine sediment metagenome TaxID=412755 RepID=A0A0F9IVF9_9ZZZZ